ncbi:hypothetical protein [Longimicrobium sp.]|uniref:hypothetical protein n=1 Tax=Longimicrobium sp. TaxID=2029185 RepID=UPI002E300F31|nr:hypothetical protein [Longimicrobium sp.]HEX6041021.1 hypothetical protein [Longimicrobium sp.]
MAARRCAGQHAAKERDPAISEVGSADQTIGGAINRRIHSAEQSISGAVGSAISINGNGADRRIRINQQER